LSSAQRAPGSGRSHGTRPERITAPMATPLLLPLSRITDARGSLVAVSEHADIPGGIGRIAIHTAPSGPVVTASAWPRTALIALDGSVAIRPGSAGAEALLLDRPDSAAIAGTCERISLEPGAVVAAVELTGEAPSTLAVVLPTPAVPAEHAPVYPRAPFRPVRLYYLYDTTAGASRGHHAHRELQQLFLAPTGAFDVHLDDGRHRWTVRLDRPDMALHVPRMHWRVLDNSSDGAVCMVLASLPYDEADYIRSYEEFKSQVQQVAEA
jgi:hypothetical protein